MRTQVEVESNKMESAKCHASEKLKIGREKKNLVLSCKKLDENIKNDEKMLRIKDEDNLRDGSKISWGFCMLKDEESLCAEKNPQNRG